MVQVLRAHLAVLGEDVGRHAEYLGRMHADPSHPSAPAATLGAPDAARSRTLALASRAYRSAGAAVAKQRTIAPGSTPAALEDVVQFPGLRLDDVVATTREVRPWVPAPAA